MYTHVDISFSMDVLGSNILYDVYEWMYMGGP